MISMGHLHHNLRILHKTFTHKMVKGLTFTRVIDCQQGNGVTEVHSNNIEIGVDHNSRLVNNNNSSSNSISNINNKICKCSSNSMNESHKVG